MSERIYIICGSSGAGKGTVCEYLSSKMNGLIWRPSDLTREVLREFDIPETRENLSKMMYVLRNRFTQDIYLYAAKEHIEKYKNITIFFDGIRKIHFIQELQKIYKCTLLYIDTPTHIRYERIRERGDKLGESRMSYEQFLGDENLESEKENSIIQELADIVIENSGSQKELFGKIDFFIANQK